MSQRETATFGAGCFWGVQARFDRLGGVIETMVGYAGGTTKTPSYQDVCTGRTGHAEVVQVTFDPDRIGYDQLLEAFWECHDPTTLNRQGPDIGTQYRSVIFTHDDTQARRAAASKDALDRSGRLRRPVVTEIVPAGPFWPAEAYHQKYLEKRSGVGALP